MNLRKLTYVFSATFLLTTSVVLFQNFSSLVLGPTHWGFSCFDNDCVWIQDKILTGSSYEITTILSSGVVLHTYPHLAPQNGHLEFRPATVYEQNLMNSAGGLEILIAPTGNSPVLQFVALKPIVSSTQYINNQGHHILGIDVNPNPNFINQDFLVKNQEVFI